MSDKTPAGKNANVAQKVLKSLEPTNSITINIMETLGAEALQQRLAAVSQFVGAMGDSIYNLMIQVDKLNEESCHDNDNK